MTDTAVNAETTVQKPNKIAMVISCLLAFPLAAVLLLHPAAMLDANGEYSHRAMMFIMIGISGGFVHGVWLYSTLSGFGNGYLAHLWLGH